LPIDITSRKNAAMRLRHFPLLSPAISSRRENSNVTATNQGSDGATFSRNLDEVARHLSTSASSIRG
jgi:hypothetical protein